MLSSEKQDVEQNQGLSSRKGHRVHILLTQFLSKCQRIPGATGSRRNNLCQAVGLEQLLRSKCYPGILLPGYSLTAVMTQKRVTCPNPRGKQGPHIHMGSSTYHMQRSKTLVQAEVLQSPAKGTSRSSTEARQGESCWAWALWSVFGRMGNFQCSEKSGSLKN